MARVRSPAYPGHSLSEAIDYIRKIHDADRQHPVDRSVAAQHMGFSGLTGTSDRALSSILHYALAEKAGKGEVRVADLALRILHPEDERERREALNAAGFSPQLFQELRRRYPGTPPNSANLESFLTREGFASVAIAPAAKAYLETCRFLVQEGAYESDSVGTSAVTESAPDDLPKEQRTVRPESFNRTEAQPVSHSNVPGLRNDVFNLSGGGQAVLSLPDVLSQRDYDDLKDWLDLMGRKAKRSVPDAQAAPPAATTITTEVSEAEEAE